MQAKPQLSAQDIQRLQVVIELIEGAQRHLSRGGARDPSFWTGQGMQSEDPLDFRPVRRNREHERTLRLFGKPLHFSPIADKLFSQLTEA